MIMLRIVIYLALFLSTSVVSAKVIAPITEVKNPVCIVDVGRVLINQSQLSNMSAYFGIILQSDNKVDLLKAGFWCMGNFSQLRTLNLQGPEDAVIDYIAQKYPVINEKTKSNIVIADEIREILCSAAPVKETQKIVADLINAGYPVALGSNKGKKTIDRMIKSGALPDLSYALIFTCDSHAQADQGIYYKKPDLQYYEVLKEQLHFKGFTDHTFIFIDNDLANVEAACRAGMVGILYTTPENLIADLELLGIVF